jgi:hypothetical protein
MTKVAISLVLFVELKICIIAFYRRIPLMPIWLIPILLLFSRMLAKCQLAACARKLLNLQASLV